MLNDSDTLADLDRRGLLAMLSASPFVLGLGSLVSGQHRGQGPAVRSRGGDQPAWFLQALRQARERDAPIVAFVIPDTRQEETTTPLLKRQKAQFRNRLRELQRVGSGKTKGIHTKGGGKIWFTIPFEDRLSRMAVYLQLLLDSKKPEMRELLLEAVFVCAPARLVGAEKSETVVILDGKGRRTGGDIVDLSDPFDVERKLQNLLHGNGKLRRRAAAARTPEVAAALARLTGKDGKLAREAHRYLVQNIRTGIPAVVEARQDDVVLRPHLDRVIASAYEKAAAKEFAGVLPFGTKIELRSVYDPCPPCGMAIVPAASRKMLKLLKN